MPSEDADVLVIGAGVAGLAAAGALSGAGVHVILIEARERTGGRVLTLHPGNASGVWPIELGAEFIHGRPREIWDIINRAKWPTHEVQGDSWHVENGRLRVGEEAFSAMDKVFSHMDPNASDESFEDFLRRCSASSDDEKLWARNFVSGFHAALPELISVHSIIRSTQADKEIDGDRAFRIDSGYDTLVEFLRSAIDMRRCALHLSTTVQEVSWQKGRVAVKAMQHGTAVTFCAPRAIVTLPLSILKLAPGNPGAVRFLPDPGSMRTAVAALEMGTTTHITLCFRERFWAAISPQPGKNLDNLSFLFSPDEWFPTWWTTMPLRTPLLTAWAGGARAQRLAGRDNQFVCQRAVEALSRLLRLKSSDIEQQLESCHVHDWQCDPFARGAYSYARVAGAEAPRQLSQPNEDTLFFAGEHSHFGGHNGTVHGAIATGLRAARQIRDQDSERAETQVKGKTDSAR